MFFSIFEMISPKELKWNNQIKMELHQAPAEAEAAPADEAEAARNPLNSSERMFS